MNQIFIFDYCLISFTQANTIDYNEMRHEGRADVNVLTVCDNIKAWHDNQAAALIYSWTFKFNPVTLKC